MWLLIEASSELKSETKAAGDGAGGMAAGGRPEWLSPDSPPNNNYNGFDSPAASGGGGRDNEFGAEGEYEREQDDDGEGYSDEDNESGSGLGAAAASALGATANETGRRPPRPRPFTGGAEVGGERYWPRSSIRNYLQQLISKPDPSSILLSPADRSAPPKSPGALAPLDVGEENGGGGNYGGLGPTSPGGDGIGVGFGGFDQGGFDQGGSDQGEFGQDGFQEGPTSPLTANGSAAPLSPHVHGFGLADVAMNAFEHKAVLLAKKKMKGADLFNDDDEVRVRCVCAWAACVLCAAHARTPLDYQISVGRAMPRVWYTNSPGRYIQVIYE